MTRCGIVALAGAPNVGKSTLLNALVGEPLAIVSPKPQTTRRPVRGLVTEERTQIILVDPAGLFDPAYPLQRGMLRAALEAIADADLVLYLHPLPEFPAPGLRRLAEELNLDKFKVDPARVLTVYTKADLASASFNSSTFNSSTFDSSTCFVVSAATREGVDALLDAIRARLPDGPFLYDPDDLGTQPLRFFAAEFIREAAYRVLEQELPYSLAVEIDEFREAETPVYIRATLAVERDSQKPIVLGKGGRTIKAIGTAARQRIAALIDRNVHLDLWVTVWPRWRKDPSALVRLGLPLPSESHP